MSRSSERVKPDGHRGKSGTGGSRKSMPRGQGRGGSLGFWLAVGVTVLTLGLRLAAALPITSSPMVMHPVLEDAAYQSRTFEILTDARPADDLPRGSILYPRIASFVPGLLSEGTRALARAQSALEALTALLLFLWMRRRWGDWAGLAAGVLYALDPVGASFAARFSPVIPATFLFVAALWAWDLERDGPGRAWPGAIAFTAVATFGFFLMPLPFLFLVLLRIGLGLRTAGHPGVLQSQQKADLPAGRTVAPAARWIRLMLPAAAMTLAVSVTLARHGSLPEGGPVLGWGGGLSLSRGYDPATGGTQRALTPPSWETRRQIEQRAWEELRREGTPYDLYQFYSSRGSSRMLGSPAATVGVLLSKAAGTVGTFPIPDELSPSFLIRRHAPFFGYLDYSFAVLLALAVAGFAARRKEGLACVLGLGLLAVGVGSVLGTASAAVRQPAIPLLAALAGAWIAGAGGARRLSPGSAAAFAGALVLSLLAGVLSPSGRLREQSEDLRLSALPLMQTFSWSRAVPLLEEAVSRNPDNLDARVDLALAYRNDARHTASEEQLEAAHAADSTHARSIHELARLKAAGNQPIPALSLYGELVRLRPHNAEYLNEYGRLLHTQGQMPEAEAALSRAVQLRPNWTTAQRNLQEVMARRMQMEEYLFPDELRAKADPEYRRVVPDIIQAMQAGDWSLADSLLSWAETEREEMAMTHWLRAAYHARRGEQAEALAELESCNRIAPGRPAVVDQLTRLYLQTGKRERVEPMLQLALEAAGEDSSRIRALNTIRRMAATAMAAQPAN